MLVATQVAAHRQALELLRNLGVIAALPLPQVHLRLLPALPRHLLPANPAKIHQAQISAVLWLMVLLPPTSSCLF